MEPAESGGWWRQRLCVYLGAFLLSLLIVGGYLLYHWLHPQPAGCSLELIRPQKFKIDVTDFFAPRVSAAMQMVLSLRNGNLLRSMLLEGCKLTAFEAETGLKLGSAQQGALVLSPFSSTQVTVTLNGLASSLPPQEQRRLAQIFLGQKAILLTIVATATSRLPLKGSRSSQLTTNSSKRLDLSTHTKEPFFQRAVAPPAEAAASDKPFDVPL